MDRAMIIPMAAPEGWRESVEVSRHHGRRHDFEAEQPIYRIVFVQGEDATRHEYFLNRDEALALHAALWTATQE